MSADLAWDEVSLDLKGELRATRWCVFTAPYCPTHHGEPKAQTSQPTPGPPRDSTKIPVKKEAHLSSQADDNL